MIDRLNAALAACQLTRADLDRALARHGLPPPETMPSSLLSALVLIVESWQR